MFCNVTHGMSTALRLSDLDIFRKTVASGALKTACFAYKQQADVGREAGGQFPSGSTRRAPCSRRDEKLRGSVKFPGRHWGRKSKVLAGLGEAFDASPSHRDDGCISNG